MHLSLDELDLDAIAPRGSSGRPARAFGGTQSHRDRLRVAGAGACRLTCTTSTTGRRSGRRGRGRVQRRALAHATIAVGNLEEVSVAVGDGEPEGLAERLLDLGLELAVVKFGPEGVLVAWSGGRSGSLPVEVEVVYGLGAGDAFGAALCHGRSRDGLFPNVRFANAAGAYVAGARVRGRDAREAQVRALMIDA